MRRRRASFGGALGFRWALGSGGGWVSKDHSRPIYVRVTLRLAPTRDVTCAQHGLARMHSHEPFKRNCKEDPLQLPALDRPRTRGAGCGGGRGQSYRPVSDQLQLQMDGFRLTTRRERRAPALETRTWATVAIDVRDASRLWRARATVTSRNRPTCATCAGS